MIEIKNPHRYFDLINRILNRYLIDNPKGLKELIRFRYSANGLEGWEIPVEQENGRVIYHDQSFININSEKGIYSLQKDTYFIEDLHYHYEPNNNGCLKFRFDLDNPLEGIHANPDPKTGMPHRVMPDDIQLDFKQMNLYLMLELVTYYIRTKNYPLDNSFAEEYNEIVNRTRGEMEDDG